MVLSATRLVKQGKVATLGKVYQQDMKLQAAWDRYAVEVGVVLTER